MRCVIGALALLALAAPASADELSDAVGRYVAWRGGPAFQSATGVLVRGTTDDGRFQGTLERRIEPGRLAERITAGSATIQRALVGKTGWTITLSGQVEDAGEAAAAEAERRRLSAFDDALAKATLAPPETLDGKPAQVLRIAFDARNAYELLLDPATGALLADRTTEEGAATTTRYSDWRMVEGVRMPFRFVQRTEDDPLVTTTVVTHVDLNPRPDPKAFARPASRKLAAFPTGRAHTDPLAFELFAGTRIVIPAAINGQAAPMMLDTGAEATVLDKAFAERLGIRPTGQVAAVGTGGRDVAELASGVTLKLGDVELKDLTVALMDLSPIAAGIGRPLPAILGKEVLNALTVQLDFQGKTITFHDPARYSAPAGAVAVPVINVAGLHAIPASIEGGSPVPMHFDLGNGQPLLVAADYWQPHKLLEGRPISKTLSGAIGGLRQRNVATVRTVTLAGVTLHDVPAIFGDADVSALNTGDTSGNLGAPILTRFEVTTDYARNRILLKPRPDAVAAPFQKDRAGVLGRPGPDGALAIALIAAGSPAEAAGLKTGQKITAVNGKPFADLGVPAFTALRTAPAGQPLALTLDGGQTVTLVLKDYY